MSNLTDEQIEAIYKQETGALIDDSPWALVDFSRAIEAAATEPLLQRIAELEQWQAAHWTALQIIDNYLVSKNLLQVVEDGGPEAAARNVVHSIAELERQLEEARAQIGQGEPEEGDLLTIAYLHGFAKGKEAASAHPAPQQKPLTDEQITAGAKALCKRSSEICGVNADDNWNLDSEYFKDDARCVLEAAHSIGEKK